MPRSTAYQFIDTDAAAIEALLVSTYERISGVSVQPASPEKLFIQFVTAIVIQERALTNYTGSQNVPSRAEGANLDALAELFYVTERPEAKAATCTERFHISEAQSVAVLIPAGTRVTDTGAALTWETTEDVYIPIGKTYADIKVTCQTAGTAGNSYSIGQINKLVDLYDYCTECENITVSDGGADRATDDEFYELMRSSMDAFSTAGAIGSYIYHAKSVSTEIADVIVVSPQPGYVDIYTLMDDGTIASEEIKGKVLAACNADTVRPLTDFVSVKDAETVPYNIAFTYYTQSDSAISATDIAAAVNEAVAEYKAWQSSKLGLDINPSHLIGLLMKTGIKRVELTEPLFTVLKNGSDKAAPQIASVKKITITNGGYEDE